MLLVSGHVSVVCYILKVLFAYSGGLCALWNVQEKKCEKRYFFDPGDMQVSGP